MDLLDEFRQEQASRKQVQCKIKNILSSMDKDDIAALEDALGDDAIQHITITNVLRKRGYDVGKHSVGAHRRGQCGCSR